MIPRTFFLLLLLLFSSMAMPFGLGSITVESRLNSPLKASIQLISVNPEGVADFRVQLASSQVFKRAGLARPFYLSKLRFNVTNLSNGEVVIAVTSREPIREPYVDFLVDVEWRGQSMVREYTVLLDPPIYTPPASSSATSKRPARAGGVSPTIEAGATYGPIKGSDTLWVIAKKLRPSSSVTIEQMMLALQRKNPDAFSQGNVNLLKRGALLAIPTHDEALLLSARAARAEFSKQTLAWKNRGKSRTKTASGARKKPGYSASISQPSLKSSSLIVVETGDEATLKGVEREGYPVKVPDKLKEAITDAEENLVAVEDINSDIAELKRTLEAKLAAFNEALAEKDKAIAELREQLEKQNKNQSQKTNEQQRAEIELELVAESKISSPATKPVAQELETQPEKIEVELTPLILSKIENFKLPSWATEKNLIVIGLSILLLLLLFVFVFRKKGAHSEMDEGKYPLTPAPVAEVGSENGAVVEPARDSFLTELVAKTTRGVTDSPAAMVQHDTQAKVADDTSAIMTEADIYLAYRRYGQAETLVKKSMGENPSSQALKAKLLEIYAFKRDKQAFSDCLDQFGTALSLQVPEHWARIVEMGESLVPNHALFNKSQEAEPAPDHLDSIFEGEQLESDLDITLDDFIIHHDEIGMDVDVKNKPGIDLSELPSWDIEVDKEFDMGDRKPEK